MCWIEADQCEKATFFTICFFFWHHRKSADAFERELSYGYVLSKITPWLIYFSK